MNTTPATATTPTLDNSKAPRSLGSIVYELSALLHNAASGDLAELRRLRPGQLAGAAFYRIAATILADTLPHQHGPLRDESEERWGAIVSAMAALGRLCAPKHSLGRSLAHAKVSEARVLRLLRARDRSLVETVHGIVHQLVATATAVDPTDIARLILSDGRSDEETVRRRIARDFYSQEETP